MFRKLRAYLILPHASAVVTVLAATAAFGLLASGGDPPMGRFGLLLAAMLGGQLAIGALNEWCDRAADAVAKPHKPIPRGDATPGGALLMAGGGLALMLASGTALGAWPLAVVVAGTGCGIVYDLGLKRTPFSWLPYLLALPLAPIWAWLTMDAFEPRLLWLYPMGALLVVAIHLAQTLPDIEGDRRRGERGLAVALGRRRALALLWLAGFGSAAAVAAGAALLGDRPAAGLAAAALAAALLLATLALHRRAPARIEAHLFELLATGAIVLGLGWVAALG